MTEFIPGLELSKSFYKEAVKPILESHFSELKYSAALIGYGSDVLDFDNLVSTDHEWGPRLLLFLSEEDYEKYQAEIDNTLSKKLPYTFKGFSTNFSSGGVQWQEYIQSGLINHKVWIQTITSFFKLSLDFNPYSNIEVLDWLTFPEQRLLEITSGLVYHDGLGQLNSIRAKFNYYPKDIWLYLLTAQWSSIAQEEAFMGRCGDVGDELGSQLIASRMIQKLMKLCFLMERRYAPYSKWFGKAFTQLSCAEQLTPIFENILVSHSWKEREEYLSKVYEVIAQMHNNLLLTKPLETSVSNYYGRPYLVIHANRFAEAIRDTIDNKKVKDLPTNVGAIDQFVASVDVLVQHQLCKNLKAIFM
ncbi:MAG: DUF4037 domain-containing protein [Xenococcaceae cyanobacterium MO_188.B29]|nr:DUF4037 domain-containing protein [Xenococcaceae cyanobacterium MO_188.B29]